MYTIDQGADATIKLLELKQTLHMGERNAMSNFDDFIEQIKETGELYLIIAKLVNCDTIAARDMLQAATEKWDERERESEERFAESEREANLEKEV